jgi:hypothetical protein
MLKIARLKHINFLDLSDNQIDESGIKVLVSSDFSGLLSLNLQ